MKLPLITASLLALFLGACATSPPVMIDMPAEDAAAFEDQAIVRWIEATAAINDMSEEDVRASMSAELSDRTSIVRQEGHGIYVEYTAPDGRFFSWYPANTSVEQGIWSVADAGSPPEACFQYKNSYHPLTGAFEPKECVQAVQIIGRVYVVDSRKGDVFELGTNGIPYTKTAEDLPVWPADR